MSLPATQTDIQTQLVAGLAEFTAAAGIGAWSPTGAYDPGVIGIYDSVIPENVDRLITLTPYGVSADPVLSDDVIGVQVRTRLPDGDPRPVRDLDGRIFDLWQGATNLSLATGVRVGSLSWQSGSTLGQDVNLRWNWTANYYAMLWHPSTNRQ